LYTSSYRNDRMRRNMGVGRRRRKLSDRRGVVYIVEFYSLQRPAAAAFGVTWRLMLVVDRGAAG
jgi:hypothetical protein